MVLQRRIMMYGWAGNILHVDLTARTVSALETSSYTELFIGGLGIAEKLYWDMAPAGADAFHPDNPLLFMTGPLAGTPVPSAPRLVVCGKSPCIFPETFVSANMGGFFAPELKKAGFDGMVVTGRADRPVRIHITNGSADILDAGRLWGMTNGQTRAALHEEYGRRIRMMSIGPAGENRTRIGIIFTDAGSSGSMGFGSVMGSKNLKAVTVSGDGSVRVADSAQVTSIRRRFKSMIGDNYFNLFGDPIILPGIEVEKKVHCHGCPQGCWRSMQKGPSGSEDIRKCQLNVFYTLWDRKLHGKPTDASFTAATLANDYGVCVMDVVFVLLWLDRCISQGILTEQQVDMPVSKMGSIEFLETFLHKLSYREGFGAVCAEGALRASEQFGDQSRAITSGFLTQTGRAIAYGPKVFVPSALIYATEPRPFITELHEVCEPLTKWALWYTSGGEKSYVSTEVLRRIAEKFWGGSVAVDFSTYDGKARAASLIQNRNFMKEALNLCDFAWPVYDDASTKEHVGDPALEAKLFSAVTGRHMDLESFNRAAERIFTLNRMILLREGRKASQDDYLPEFLFIERDEMIADVFGMHNPELYLPAKGDEVISRKGKAVDKAGFERMKKEYYELRGWDAETGIPTPETLQKLGLEESIEGRSI